MAYADRYLSELEGSRKNALAAVTAYVALLGKGRDMTDMSGNIREKIDVLLPPMSKFKSVIGIAKV